MMYAVNILTNVIKEHKKIIEQLKDTDIELVCDDFFMQEEIAERELYIKMLQDAIEKLLNNQ